MRRWVLLILALLVLAELAPGASASTAPRAASGVPLCSGGSVGSVGHPGVPVSRGSTPICGWEWATIPHAVASGQYNLNDILYVNSTVAVIVGQLGTILRTTDGGQVWSSVPSPISGDYYHGLASIPGAGLILAGGFDGSLIPSPNGGVSWTGYPEHGLLGNVTDLAFPSSTFGYAVTSQGLFVTSDAGQDWASVSLPTPGSAWAGAFSTPSVGWVDSGVNPEVYFTTDGGQQWTKLDLGLSPNRLSDVVPEGDRGVWVLGDQGVAWWASDQTNFVESQLATQQHTWQLFALGANAWVVSDDANMFYTADQGQCWVEESVPQIPEIYAINFWNQNDGIAAGDGVVWYTTDSGLGANDTSSCAPSSAVVNRVPYVIGLGILAALVATMFEIRRIVRADRAQRESSAPPPEHAREELRRKLRYRNRKRYVR